MAPLLLNAVTKRFATAGCGRRGGSAAVRGRLPVCAAVNEGAERPLWVFSAEPPRGSNYTMLDVRDAVEACSPATDPEERQQCFLNFGLDSKAVDTYYDQVMKLEDALVEQPSEEDLLAQRMVRMAGFFLCLVVGCKVV